MVLVIYSLKILKILIEKISEILYVFSQFSYQMWPLGGTRDHAIYIICSYPQILVSMGVPSVLLRRGRYVCAEEIFHFLFLVWGPGRLWPSIKTPQRRASAHHSKSRNMVGRKANLVLGFLSPIPNLILFNPQALPQGTCPVFPLYFFHCYTFSYKAANIVLPLWSL